MSKARPMLDDTPAAAWLNDAWRGIRDWTRELRVSKDLQPTLDRLREYAELNLARNHGASEFIGATLMAQKQGNEDYLTFMTSKRANGQAAFFKSADLSPDTTLQLLVQVGGKYPSRSYEGPGGKQVDGPASVLPVFSNAGMRREYGDNLSALQIMYFVCRSAKKVRAADWAEGMHAIICSAVHEYASTHGLERDLKKKYMVKPPRMTDAEIKAQFEEMKKRAKQALAEGVPHQKPGDSPVADTFNEMIGSLNTAQALAAFNALAVKLGVQIPSAAPSVASAPATPETAFAAAVGDRVKSAPAVTPSDVKVSEAKPKRAKAPAKETAKAAAKAPAKRRTSVKAPAPKR